MSNWKSVLKADPTDWLLEKDNPSIRYWTLKDLLHKSESEPEVAGTKRKISESKEVQMIFSKIDINGGPFWSKSNGDIYWGSFSTGSVLWFLAETGLTKMGPKIEDLAKFLFRYQSAEGFFKLSPRGPGWWSCLGLEKGAGELRYTKSGHGVMFVRKRAAFDEFLVAPKEKLEEFVKGKSASVEFALITGDHK